MPIAPHKATEKKNNGKEIATNHALPVGQISRNYEKASNLMHINKAICGADAPALHAARSKPSQERLALKYLAAQNFVCGPQVEIEGIKAGRWRCQKLFSGYVFVFCHMEPASRRAINGTRGIQRLLSFCDGKRRQFRWRGGVCKSVKKDNSNIPSFGVSAKAI
jgi:transcription antitermination factor NusG